MRLPPLAQNLGSGIPVVGAERHTKQISKLAVKIADPGLWTSEHAHLGIALRRQPLGEDAQGNRLADPDIAADIESFRYQRL
jgi:hypothetical protein